jgi:HlyD family secretion protein
MKRIFLFIGIAGTLVSCSKNEPIISGKLKRDVVYVSGKLPGRVETLRVNEGDHVKRGDTLAILSIPEAEAKLLQADGALLSADAQYEMAMNGATTNQIAQLRAKYSGLEEQYNFAQKSVNRLQSMLTDSLIAKQKYDEAYAKLQGAKAQFDAVKAELAEAEHGVRSESKAMALGQKKRAEGAVREIETALDERVLLAPCDMTIETITLHTGELLLPGYTLFTGYMDGTENFRFTLPESDVAQLKIGNDVHVKIANHDQNITAKIKSVRALARYAEISSTRPEIKPGEPVFEIIITPIDKSSLQNVWTNSTVFLQK